MESILNILTSPFNSSLKNLPIDSFFENLFVKALTPDEILNFTINGIYLYGIPFYQFQENNFKSFLERSLELFQAENFSKLYLLYFQIFALFIDPIASKNQMNQIKINIDEIDEFLKQLFFFYFEEDLKGIEEKVTNSYKSSQIRITEFQNLYNYLSITLRKLENEYFVILECDKLDEGKIEKRINEQEWRNRLKEVLIPPNGKNKFEDKIIQKFILKKQRLLNHSEQLRNQNPIIDIQKIENPSLNNLLGLSNMKNFQPPTKLEELTYFIRGSRLNIMEGIDIEFKNYTFRLDAERTFIMKKTICSFLNTKGGRIYIGIRDKDLMVFGICLTMAMKDEIKREIDDLLFHFHPQVDPSECVTKFIPVKDENLTIIPGYYVIKIIVKRGKINDIYVIKEQNGGISAYFRRDGKNSSLLTPNDLKKEIIERSTISKEKAIKENEEYNARYNDPEPENNILIITNFMNSNKNNKFKNSNKNNVSSIPKSNQTIFSSNYSQQMKAAEKQDIKNIFNYQNYDPNNTEAYNMGSQANVEKNKATNNIYNANSVNLHNGGIQLPFERTILNNQNAILNSTNFPNLGGQIQVPLDRNSLNIQRLNLNSTNISNASQNLNDPVQNIFENSAYSQLNSNNENQKKFSKLPKEIKKKKNFKSLYIRFQMIVNEKDADYINLENYILSLKKSFSCQAKPPCSFCFFFNSEEDATDVLQILQERKETLKLSIIDYCFD